VATDPSPRQPSSELKGIAYEFVVGTLSVLSIANIVLIFVYGSDSAMGEVALYMNFFLSLIFLADFAYRLFTAESKSAYFFRHFGWADLLASLPFAELKIFRVFRVVRVGRLMREYGAKNMALEFLRDPASSALLSLLLFISLVVEFGSLAEVGVESGAPDANITNGGIAMWYTFVTITTVGYGDHYPVTPAGRIIGVVIMVTGVGLFGTFAGYLSNMFFRSHGKAAGSEGQGAVADDPQTVLAQLRGLLADQQKAQMELEAKVGELESLLATGSAGDD
jgi:voltage-gated potassium channel